MDVVLNLLEGRGFNALQIIIGTLAVIVAIAVPLWIWQQQREAQEQEEWRERERRRRERKERERARQAEEAKVGKALSDALRANADMLAARNELRRVLRSVPVNIEKYLLSKDAPKRRFGMFVAGKSNSLPHWSEVAALEFHIYLHSQWDEVEELWSRATHDNGR